LYVFLFFILSVIPIACKMPASWHWTDHLGGYWQQAELGTELVQGKQR